MELTAQSCPYVVTLLIENDQVNLDARLRQ